MAKFIVVILVIIAGAKASSWISCTDCESAEAPTLDADAWWGPSELKEENDTSIRNFTIEFTSTMVEDLQTRLKNHRNFTPGLEGVGFEYGFNADVMDEWLSFWADEYPFEERQEFFNQYPTYKTNIQGLDIFFIRVTPEVSENVTVLPMLMLHGWPGSVREFFEVIPLLTQQNSTYDFVFELIIPSLPGFGYSDPAVRPGMGSAQVAVIMRNLMLRLGFEQFYVQGGDWGAIIVSSLATLYPDNVLGHHSNFFSILNSCTNVNLLVEAFLPYLSRSAEWTNETSVTATILSHFVEEWGYFHMQATKPDTIGLAVSNSPAGLLAYILEKFSSATNSELKNRTDGGLGYRFTKVQLIDNLMMYWAPNAMNTAMRLYAESMSDDNRFLGLDSVKSSVPTCVVKAKHELTQQPDELLTSKYVNLLNSTTLNDGGHFLAFELPQLFAETVFNGIKIIRDWREENA